jgi:small-conductance mechanosensitive channel
MNHKEIFKKVFADAILNVIFYGIGVLVIVFTINVLKWEMMGLGAGGILAIVTLFSLIPFLISFVAGIVAIPLALKEKLAGNNEAFADQCWLWAGNIVQLIENSILVLYLFFLYRIYSGK